MDIFIVECILKPLKSFVSCLCALLWLFSKLEASTPTSLLKAPKKEKKVVAFLFFSLSSSS